jgi:hypothetical protein
LQVIDITDRFEATAPDGDLVGFGLDSPAAASTSSVYALPFEGWLLTQRSPATRLEVHRDGVFVDYIPVGSERPDIAEAFPAIPWAADTGFRFQMSALSLPPEFELSVAGVLEDNSRVWLAGLRGRRRYCESRADGIQPLMLTTLGRTGSTWVTKVLAGHPEVVAYPPFQSEVRLASYWTDVLISLSQPASYRQSVAALIEGEDWWLGEHRRPNDFFNDEQVLEFLGRDQVEALMRFCRDRIVAFYERFTPPGAGHPARYFVEKRLPTRRRQIYALRDMFPATREIFLVRDFRDMLASIIAYNELHGHGYFERDEATSDAEYVREHLAVSIGELMATWRERSDWAHLVRYEDLVQEPHETLRGVLRHLGLAEDEGAIEQMLAAGESREGSRQARHRTSTSAAGSIGRWRTDLSPELAEVCDEAFGEALEQFGYER